MEKDKLKFRGYPELTGRMARQDVLTLAHGHITANVSRGILGAGTGPLFPFDNSGHSAANLPNNKFPRKAGTGGGLGGGGNTPTTAQGEINDDEPAQRRREGRHIRSCPILSYPILSYPILSYPRGFPALFKRSALDESPHPHLVSAYFVCGFKAIHRAIAVLNGVWPSAGPTVQYMVGSTSSNPADAMDLPSQCCTFPRPETRSLRRPAACPQTCRHS